MSNDTEQAFCRFCWDTAHDVANPLIQCCLCSGGVKYVHLTCLRQWVETKMQKQESAKVQMFVWSSFQCEICKTVFPFRFKTKLTGRKYTLLEMQTDKTKNYLVLELFCIDKPMSKVVFLLTPTALQQSFKVGRANDQDVRINDISSSRAHAQIVFDGKKFTI